MTAAMAFEQWWQLQGEWVEEPNRRRGGESGVQRLQLEQGRVLYAKRQVGHFYRSLRHPLGRPTVLRERDALLALARIGVKAPNLLFCEVRKDAAGTWRGLLVSEELEGFQEVNRWYAEGGRERFGPEVNHRLLEQIAQMLARFHRAGWQHGCLYQKHVFVRVEQVGAQVEIETALLDLEKSRRRLSRQRAARHDMLQLKRHSSWAAGDWARLIYCYQQAFGSAIKGLQS
ncbi:lipopolysaccharide kinase InaA family protein [Pseudomonas zhanjiangensis]|uniref:Lipopolysaccharide kinase InaA family protein n=1 Tax=Pseudomonas zhanjiangensis TaxID=3239015 RepID=A0ABV3YU43_9PSED